MFIDLDPFRFVQFLDLGLNTDKFIDSNPENLPLNTSIYFLAEYQTRLYLMMFKTFPWPVNYKWVDESRKHWF
jgi:hypothetical protein